VVEAPLKVGDWVKWGASMRGQIRGIDGAHAWIFNGLYHTAALSSLTRIKAPQS